MGPILKNRIMKNLEITLICILRNNKVEVIHLKKETTNTMNHPIMKDTGKIPK